MDIDDFEEFTEHFDLPCSIEYGKDKHYIDFDGIGIVNFREKNKKLVVSEQNENFEVYERFGFKINNYGEFLIEGVNFFSTNLEFTIGEMTIKVTKASSLFAYVLSDIEGKHFEGWEEIVVIQITNLTEEQIEDILFQIKFIIGYFFSYENPDIRAEFIERTPDDYDGDLLFETRVDKETGSPNFSKLKHLTAIKYYEEGVDIMYTEIAFLYFYKVIEYFFQYTRSNEFELLLDNYKKSSDLDTFILAVSKIYKKSELANVNFILASIEYPEYIQNQSFAKDLYDYRCSLVHSKSNFDSLTLPSVIKSPNIPEWTLIAKSIAEVLIKKYCI